MSEREERLKELIEQEREAYEIRKSMANWNFINSQPPKIKAALIFYIKTGDIRKACKIANMSIEDFRELLRKANIPVVL